MEHSLLLKELPFSIQNLARGKVLRGEVDVYPRKIAARKMVLREEKVNQILGTELKKEEMADILNQLQLEVSSKEKELLVSVPTFRVDLEREIDLIEEIARIYGYNEIKPTLPGGRRRVGALNFEQKVERKVKETLVASGLYEVLNYSMINPQFFEDANLPENHPWRKEVSLVNPLAADQSMLRTTLLPSLITTLSLNKSRGERSVHIFEVGKVFRRGKENIPEEFKMVGIALMGSWYEKAWYSKEEKIDLYDLKGIVENVMHSLKIDDWEIEESENPLFYPARFGLIKIFQDEVGFLGELHPFLKEKFDFEEDVFLAELSLDKLLKYAQFGWIYEEIPQFPGISFDISLLVDVEVKAKEVEKVIKENGGPFLQKVEIFDVYTGKNIPKGKKSLAFSLLFLSKERTLREEEISESVEKVIEALEKKLSAQVRRKVG
jgi:phenylalanyl-tRNA synthetase beta chain